MSRKTELFCQTGSAATENIFVPKMTSLPKRILANFADAEDLSTTYGIGRYWSEENKIMAKVIYIDADDNRTEVEIEPGESIMSLAINNLVEGILGDCGGAMACATCHCYLSAEYADKFAPIGDMETEMLEVALGRQSNSRLSCQLVLTADMEDVEVRLPAEQS